MTTDPRIVDLFAGPRGWDTGARFAGITDVLGVENNQQAHDTALAAGHHGILADITTLDPLEVCGTALEGLIASPPCPGFSAAGKGLGRKDFLMLHGAIDDLASGVDPADVLEGVRARQHDERSALTLEPLKWALATEPEWVAFEQVPTVLPLWEAYAPVLEAEGYNVWTGVVYAEQYGVPQTRKRAILLAHRSRVVARPVPTHSRYHSRSPQKLDEGVEKWVSMAEALGWNAAHVLTSHQRTQKTRGGEPEPYRRSVDAPAPTLTGGGSRSWVHGEAPLEFEPEAMLAAGRVGGGAPRPVGHPSPTITGAGSAVWIGEEQRLPIGDPADVLFCATNDRPNAAKRRGDEPAPTLAFGHERPRWIPTPALEGETEADCEWVYERPSPTVVGSFHPDVVAKPGYRKAGDPPRQKTPGSVRVTLAEAAVLQSFPADYPWQGTKTQAFQQVGNAVPPLLAAHVMRALGVEADASESSLTA